VRRNPRPFGSLIQAPSQTIADAVSWAGVRPRARAFNRLMLHPISRRDRSSAGANAERSTVIGDSMMRSPGEPPRNSQPAASRTNKRRSIFRISRSNRSWRFSFRSRASSSRSAVVSPVRRLVRSMRVRFTHSRSAVSARSRSHYRADAFAVVQDQSDRWALKASSNCPRVRRVSLSLPSVWTSYSPLERCPLIPIKPMPPGRTRTGRSSRVAPVVRRWLRCSAGCSAWPLWEILTPKSTGSSDASLRFRTILKVFTSVGGEHRMSFLWWGGEPASDALLQSQQQDAVAEPAVAPVPTPYPVRRRLQWLA
jgi:hypothetical protein